MFLFVAVSCSSSKIHFQLELTWIFIWQLFLMNIEISYMVVEAPKKKVFRRGGKMIFARKKHSKGEVLVFLFISNLGLWQCQFSVVMAGTMIFITRLSTLQKHCYIVGTFNADLK
jgi:hypothetical protein